LLLFVIDLPDNMITEQARAMETGYSVYWTVGLLVVSASWVVAFVLLLVLLAWWARWMVMGDGAPIVDRRVVSLPAMFG
jgi:hypothetical protein